MTDCFLNGCHHLHVPFYIQVPASKNLQCFLKERKSPCHFLLRDSLQFFSYFLLLHSLNYFLFCFHCYHSMLLSSTSYIMATFTLASGHPGLEMRDTVLLCSTRTIKYTKAHELVEYAYAWQFSPDMWTNLCAWTCKCMFASLKVCNLKAHVSGTYCNAPLFISHSGILNLLFFLCWSL